MRVIRWREPTAEQPYNPRHHDKKAWAERIKALQAKHQHGAVKLGRPVRSVRVIIDGDPEPKIYLSQKDAAKATGLPVSTVNRLLARKKLRYRNLFITYADNNCNTGRQIEAEHEETGERRTFTNMHHAAAEIGCSTALVRDCASGKLWSAKGWILLYAGTQHKGRP